MKDNRITRPEARVLAEEEFVRFADLVESLTADEWARPTDCTQWDVRKIALHVLGSADAQASVRELAHQLRRGLPLNKEIDSHHWVDGLNELQIRERSHLSTDELVARLRAVGPNAVKGRWRTPPPARNVPLPFGPPIGWAPLKYLLDVGFTRDVWAHRIDIHTAIDRPINLTADHDGRLVADIVAEWATIHGQPFELVLDGPAGGKFSHGAHGERIEIDAVDFIRTLSGRLPGTGVLANPLPL
ncbi:MAG TPA: maleylpyruvate isomerase family mycothiol-dependent enzyme [Jiangellaceae bacterium]|nr:maleylpyruvate isomerase family mycothiol-dependent enzyme [Jiangellaceae bacterium]